MSFLNTASESRIWMSALGFESDDPYRYRNIAAEVTSAHIPKLFRESTKIRHVGTGGVFDVLLYEHKKAFFAVKRARRHNRGRGQIAFQEIRVVSKPFLRRHTNIIDILGWDWSDDQSPALFTYFAEQGTLRDFLQRNKGLSLTNKRHFAIDIASGLHALHAADIAHGDVKLINTLVFPDNRNPKSWVVKVADFSHSVFGLSLRRQTSYPGTVLYNAPEVRGQDAYVTSYELVLCESFSYGLLLWEILSNGEEYIDPAWIGGEPETEGTARREAFLRGLPKNGLLDRALSFICSNSGLSTSIDMAIFHSIFNMTLKDNAAYRKDMATIATSLDSSDRASIEYSLEDLSLERINVWDFDPWQNGTWLSKKQFVSELEDKLFSPKQPSHAEFHFLMSRCYAEGYGVPQNIPTAVHHLVEASKFGSIDAIWIVEACRGHLLGLKDRKFNIISSMAETQSSVVATVRNILSAVNSLIDNAHGDTTDSPMEEVSTGREFPAYLHSWNLGSKQYTLSRGFTAQLRDGRENYEWTRDSDRFESIVSDAENYGILLCNVNIQYPTLLSPNTTAPFLEVCSSLGRLKKKHLLLLEDSQFTDTSYRSQGQFYLRLMVAAARHGRWLLVRSLIREMREMFSEQATTIHSYVDPETGESPLHYLPSLQASDDERLTLIEELQNLGYDVNGIMRARSWLLPFGIQIYGTPLQAAIRSRCLRTVKGLVTAGADCSLSYGDAPPPLILATSMHCKLIVEYLLDIDLQRRRALESLERHRVLESFGSRRALESLGVPTKKGWFEHLFPEVEGHCRLYNLIETARPFIERLLTPDEDGKSKLDWGKLDGSPLLEALRKGQKDLCVFAILIKLGFGPRTFSKRRELLKLAVSQEKEDPFRMQLLALLLIRRELERSIGFVDFPENLESHLSQWTDGWADFFRDKKHGLPWIDLLVQDGETGVLKLILTLYPHIAPKLVTKKDRQGLTPAHIAILHHNKPLFWVLMQPIISKLRARDRLFSRRSLRDVSQDAIDEAISSEAINTLRKRGQRLGKEIQKVNLC